MATNLRLFTDRRQPKLLSRRAVRGSPDGAVRGSPDGAVRGSPDPARFCRKPRVSLRAACGVLALLLWPLSTAADDDYPVNARGIRFTEQQVQRLRVGVTIETTGPCRGITCTIPVPKEWPEQQVTIVEEDISPQIPHVEYRELGGGIRQMLLRIPVLPANQVVRAMVTYEIRRRAIEPPSDGSVFDIPSSTPREMRLYLAPSPYIESASPTIRSLAKKIVADKSTAWQQVEAIYDYVRENVRYQSGELKGAVQALRDRRGDCEELTSLFIALCRANKIPARMVWVTDHCYPEFYLVDQDQVGHWIPCQVAGSRAFGGMPEMRPILQKGDSFLVPEKKGRQRYVAELFHAREIRKGYEPKISFVREFVPVEP